MPARVEMVCSSCRQAQARHPRAQRCVHCGGRLQRPQQELASFPFPCPDNHEQRAGACPTCQGRNQVTLHARSQVAAQRMWDTMRGYTGKGNRFHLLAMQKHVIVARIQHTCEQCGQPIPQGSRYRLVSRHKVHLRCPRRPSSLARGELQTLQSREMGDG